MLLRTLFSLLLLAVLGESIVYAVHALAETVVRRQALGAVSAQIDASLTAARNAVADAIANGGDPNSPRPIPPSPRATCVMVTQKGCVLTASATIAFQRSDPKSSPSPCASGSCTIYEQANDAVDEGRIDALVDAKASGADGTVLAAREARVTFRTTLVPPYAVVAGQADVTTLRTQSPGAGDDGGAAPFGTAPGTLIDVLYRNRTTGATMPANVWRPHVESDAGAAPAWEP